MTGEKDSLKRRALLVNPWITDFAAYDFWMKPMGLLSVGAILRKLGFELDLVDCLDRADPEWLAWAGKRLPKQKRFGTGKYFREIIEKPAIFAKIPRHFARYGLPLELFREKLRRLFPPDVILVTSYMTYWYPGVREAVQILREYFPKTPILLGGVYATLMPEHARRTVQPDVLVAGEGEPKIRDVLADFFPDLPEPELSPNDLDSYPLPVYDLYPRLQSLPVLTARGCPFRCTFCASFLVAGKFRKRSPNSVVNEIAEAYHRYRIRDFAFYDDALLVAKNRHIVPILEALLARGLPLRFHTPNGLHAREIDRDLARLLVQTGFQTIRLSFETANPERLRDMSSKVTPDDLANAVDALEAAGFPRKRVEVYVLIGLPGQSEDEMMRSILLVHRLGVKIRLANFSPIPGTVEWKRAEEMGLVDESTDLLWTNNTVFGYLLGEEHQKKLDALARLVKVLNQAVDLKANLLDESVVGSLFRKWVKTL